MEKESRSYVLRSGNESTGELDGVQTPVTGPAQEVQMPHAAKKSETTLTIPKELEAGPRKMAA